MQFRYFKTKEEQLYLSKQGNKKLFNPIVFKEEGGNIIIDCDNTGGFWRGLKEGTDECQRPNHC